MTPPIAVQLYSVRDLLAADFEGVLRHIADMGYPGVEMAGNNGSGGPAEAANFIRSLGMEVASAHLGLPEGGDASEQIRIAGELGITNWVVPWIPPEKFATPEAVQEQIASLNSAAAIAREAGLTLLYHNHWFEFEPTPGLGGKTPYETMKRALSPDVYWEIDAYWVQTGGTDAGSVLAELGEHVKLLHVKDGPCSVEKSMLAVGDGVMDYPTILPHAKSDWLIVELDRCDTDMMEAVQRSYTYLTQGGFAHGRA